MFIHNWFEQAASQFAASIALSMDSEQLTYAELDQLSNKIAHKLKNEGVKSGDIVGISLRRSPELIASIIGILKAGAAYLPLDPEYPVERLKYMVSHSLVKTILSHHEFSAIFEQANVTNIVFEKIDFDSLHSTPVVTDAGKTDLCYVIYTSGSTGNPKGVSLGHKALVNLIEWQNTQTRIKTGLSTLQFTPVSFDVHFQEIFATLTTGGRLVLISENTRLNPVKLLKTLAEQKVGRMFLPYVALNQLAETAEVAGIFPESLKEVTTAGEQLKVTPAIRKFFKRLDDACLYNHYGPSESHVVTSLTLSGNPEAWPGLPSIGKAISNTQVHLLDEMMEPVVQGQEGDIYLAGVCLANGYLNAPDLTSEKFITDSKLGRLYKTGDIGIEQADGNIQFLGRKDGQVKIRGYRIETGEIELVLQKQTGVNQSAVKIIEIENEKSICGYITGNVNIQAIRDGLKQSLPEYMIPSHIIKLETIPLTPSGKVDYKSLPLPSTDRPELMNEFIAPFSDNHKTIAGIWKRHLKLKEVGIQDSFFDLGGNSLLAIRILIEVNQALNSDLSIVQFFQSPTIQQLANILEGDDFNLSIEASDSSVNSGAIAIIGVAGRFPGAESVEELWENLLVGKNSVTKFSPQEADPTVTDAQLKDPNYLLAHGVFPGQESFDYKFFGMTPREAELMDPQQRKFLELSVEALEAAGYHSENSKQSIGIFAGMANSKYSRLVDQHPDKVAQMGEFNVMLGLEKDYIATRVAYKLNLTGPALSLHTGCSTSLVAIIEAVKSLRQKNCQMALAGGISISGMPNTGHHFQEGGILSHDGLCRPFDEKATGTIFTEGAGIVVLKRLEDAQRDGDNILGVIKGVGINNDGADKMSFTAPSVKGQADAILKAHKDAGIDARSIDYIEAHGTATPVGDPIEVEALRKAFRFSTQDTSFCYLSSIKSNLGHLTSAAGVAGLIKALMVVKTGKVPGTVNYQSPNKHLDLASSPFIVTSETNILEAKSTPRRAGISSFGVGGTNGHIIIEEYIAPEKEINASVIEPTIFKLSAKSEAQVKLMEKALLSKLAEKSLNEWRKIAYTLEVGRKEYSHRRFLALSSHEDLNKVSPANSGSNSVKASLPLYMMFPGQGSQYAGMGKQLYQSSMVFRSEVDKCAEILKAFSGYDIRDVLFQEEDKLKLNNTYYTQPAIFVIEYSLAKTYLAMGYKPNGFIGHSIGEYVAATLAGIFTLEDGLKIIAKRAQLMMKVQSGMMLSVASSAEIVKDLLNDVTLDIAAINAPASVVVAGEENQVKAFQDKLTQLNIGSVILKTSHAFHSRMMEPIVAEFKEFISSFELKKPKTPIFSTVLTEINDDALTTATYWAEHIVNTVSFAPTMHNVLALGEAVYLEIGPKNTLVNLTRKQAINDGIKNLRAFTSMADTVSSEAFTMTKSLGELWLGGHKMPAAALLFRKEEQKRTEAPVYIFEKNRVWLEPKNKRQPLNIETLKLTGNTQMKDSKKDQFKDSLIEIFESSSGIEVREFGTDVTFLEMGMDSLFLTQISLQLKKELKIQVSFRQLLEEYSTINQLADAFIDQADIKCSAPVAAPQTISPVAQTIIPQPVMEQVQVQQLAQAPQTVAQPTTEYVQSAPISGTGVEQIIQRQLDLMNQQMLLLRNANVSASASIPTPIVQPAPVAVPKVANIAKPEPVSKKEVSRGADIRSAKDSFGAAAKINVDKTGKFSEQQNKNIQEFFRNYSEKTKSSKKFTQDHRKTHADPRVVTGFKPENKEIIYPIVVKKSEQQYLWDLDDNKYIDMICGFGSNFFGNGNAHIKKLVLKQLEEGIEIGPQHPLVGEVSKLICDLTGNDRAAFCNTGSEAVLGAMRLARTVTGREKIIVFSGSYHGINDEVIIRTAREKSYPAAPGINGAAVSNMIVLDYGTEESLKIIREMASEVAAVLVEPVQSRRCNFHPKEFLKELRKITTENQTCLIFDEVITGFRIHPGGAQAHFGIRADLCTYGKIVGGGMPIGVISGKTEYMDALDGGHWSFGDDSTPTVGVTYFAGTFVRHPLALAAAKGALEIIRDGGEKLLSELNNKAQKFADEINSYCKAANVPLEMHNFGTLMKPKWMSDVQGGELLFAILRYNGVHAYDGFPWFINMAHTDKDIETVLTTIKKGIMTLQDMGLLPDSVRVEINQPKIFDASNAPVKGAKLGKDDKGNPAWFMENPANPGEYYLIEG